MISIIVYIIAALLMYRPLRSLCYIPPQCVSAKEYEMKHGSIMVSMLIFAALAGMRFQTGVDHLSYLADYLNVGRGQELAWDSEPLFVFITTAMSRLGIHYVFYFGVLAFIQVYFVYRSVEHRAYLLPYIALLLVLGTYFLDFSNGIRQYVVCSFMLFVTSHYIIKNKPLYVLGSIMLGTTMHSSAIILLPLIALCFYTPILKNKWLNILLVFACIILGNTKFWIAGLDYVSNALEFMGLSKYSGDFEKFMDGNMGREVAFGPLRLTSLALNLIIIWFYKPMRAFYNGDRYLDTCFFLFFIGVCGYNLFTNAGLLFVRVLMYFTIFTLPMTAYLLVYLKKKYSRMLYNVILVIALSYSSLNVVKHAIIPNRTFIEEANLYKFFFGYDEKDVYLKLSKFN